MTEKGWQSWQGWLQNVENVTFVENVVFVIFGEQGEQGERLVFSLRDLTEIKRWIKMNKEEGELYKKYNSIIFFILKG